MTKRGSDMRRLNLPSVIALAVTLFCATALSQPASAAARPGVAVVRVSADPYSTSDAQHRTEVEPDSAAAGGRVVAAFQVGRRFAPGGAANIGWATSGDGGRTFTSGFLPGITKVAGGPYDLASDPSVAHDAAHHVWLISSLAGMAVGPPFVGAAIVVSRSSDGVHWSDPVTVASAPPLGGFDKNWTSCDDSRSSRFFGHCYTEFDNEFAGFPLNMSTSSDGGQSWAPAVQAAGGAGQAGVPVVKPDGTAVVPFIGPGDPFTTRTTIGAVRSTDGGHSWTAPVTVSSVSFHLPPVLRAPVSVSSGVDRDGNVYVIWADCRFRVGCASNDLVISRSADGVTWTPPARIPIDPIDSGVDHFIAGLAVDRHTAGDHAHLAITYYGYPNAACDLATCRLTVDSVSSTDGGHSWSAATMLAGPIGLDWLANTTRGRMVGDYISTSFVHGRAIPFFADANPPTGGSLDEAIATVAGGLRVNGGP